MLKERLLILIEEEGLNPNQFYVKSGLANGFLNTVGDKLRKPSIEKIINAFPYWNIEWILTGEGEKKKEGGIDIVDTTSQQRSTILIDKEAWDVIKMQARSLERKDDQMAELIQILKSDREKIPIKVAEDAGCADAKASSGE